MSETKKPTPTSDAGRSPERIRDPSAGLERMKKTLKQMLKVPKPVGKNANSKGPGTT